MLSQDQITFISALVISAPLSFGLRKISSATARYVYSLILGTLLQFYTYGQDIWMPILTHVIIYVLILIKGRKCGRFITILSIAGLSAYHIYRMLEDYGSWKLDISTILMSMVCKYSIFAYAYEDGGIPLENLNTGQQATRLQKLPSLWNYLVYCQFLPTCIIGTAVQYKDFDHFMRMQAPFNNVPGKLQLKSIFADLFQGLVCGGVFVLHVMFFPLSEMQKVSFSSQSAFYIFYYSFFCVTTIRFKYYFGWKLSQIAVHASGISYKPQSNSFNRVQTCNPWTVETSIHLRDKISSWNMSCELWLRRCIYERTPFKNKQVSQAYVFMISAFWHGFYGGYYISFGLWFIQIALATNVFKFAQKKPNHPFMKAYRKVTVLGRALIFLGVNWSFSHSGLYFQVLDSSHCYEILKQVMFVPPLLLVGGTLLFSRMMTGKKYLVQKDHEVAKKLGMQREFSGQQKAKNM